LTLIGRGRYDRLVSAQDQAHWRRDRTILAEWIELVTGMGFTPAGKR
jgi:hypothetical protein